MPEGVTPAERPREPEDVLAPVPLWALLAALLSVFLVASIAGALIAIGIEAAGGDVGGQTPDGLLISATLVQDAALVGAAVGFASLWASGLTVATFGLRPTSVAPALGWSLLVFGGFWLLTAVLVAAFGQPDQQDLTRDLRQADSTAVLVGYAVLLAFVAPLTEEFFFRGFVFGVLRARLGVVWGVLIGGSSFGLIHLPSSPLLSVAVLAGFGIGLCLLYHLTGSLLPCIALHAINNAIAFVATRDYAIAEGVLFVLGSAAAAVAVAAAVMKRSPALPGAPRTP